MTLKALYLLALVLLLSVQKSVASEPARTPDQFEVQTFIAEGVAMLRPYEQDNLNLIWELDDIHLILSDLSKLQTNTDPKDWDALENKVVDDFISLERWDMMLNTLHTI